MDTALTLAQTSTSTGSGNATGVLIFYACMGVVTLITVIAQWIVFSKAGQPGIASIVPFWNIVVMFQIAGMPWWYALIFFVPLLNILGFILLFAAYLGIARAFGQGFLFGLGLCFLGPIFWIILAFDDYEYVL